MPAVVILALGTCMVSGVAHYIAVAAKKGDLDRNAALGIRTRATMASDSAWRTGHVAAAPWMLSAAATGYFGAVVTAIAAWMAAVGAARDFTAFVVGIVSLLAVTAILAKGAVIAHDAASRTS